MSALNSKHLTYLEFNNGCTAPFRKNVIPVHNFKSPFKAFFPTVRKTQCWCILENQYHDIAIFAKFCHQLINTGKPIWWLGPGVNPRTSKKPQQLENYSFMLKCFCFGWWITFFVWWNYVVCLKASLATVDQVSIYRLSAQMVKCETKLPGAFNCFNDILPGFIFLLANKELSPVIFLLTLEHFTSRRHVNFLNLKSKSHNQSELFITQVA